MEKQVKRDYGKWHTLKGDLEIGHFEANYSEREVWWCSLGANIGFEEDGKNHLFERPVLVVKKYSKELFLGVPLSTKLKNSRYYHHIAVGDKNGVVILSQARALSSKRLQRRIGRITENDHQSIWRQYIGLHTSQKSDSAVKRSPRAPNGDLYVYDTKHERKSQGGSL
ncbi:type II toxin-antitoxin system PemK/MazF family toxin [Candidatus Saccharibacteria bacterium]|nr:type II toxin-antitoxin system PemK/MazF family toxin [Candidatus Saccharibacteria bacterium]